MEFETEPCAYGAQLDPLIQARATAGWEHYQTATGCFHKGAGAWSSVGFTLFFRRQKPAEKSAEPAAASRGQAVGNAGRAARR